MFDKSFVDAVQVRIKRIKHQMFFCCFFYGKHSSKSPNSSRVFLTRFGLHQNNNHHRLGGLQVIKMKIREIDAQSASDTVVKQILANMESGDLRPGDRLPTQEQLGQMFGVGRSSIREATNALAIMGYLEITQGRGTFIKSTAPLAAVEGNSAGIFGDGANLFNLIDLREILECHAIEQAALHATDQQLLALKRSAEKLEACRVNMNNFLSADLEFHQTIALTGNNPELGVVLQHIHKATNIKVPVAFTTSSVENIGKAIDTAQKIYFHIVKGEKLQAQRYLRNHLSISREAIARNVEQASQ